MLFYYESLNVCIKMDCCKHISQHGGVLFLNFVVRIFRGIFQNCYVLRAFRGFGGSDFYIKAIFLHSSVSSCYTPYSCDGHFPLTSHSGWEAHTLAWWHSSLSQVAINSGKLTNCYQTTASWLTSNWKDKKAKKITGIPDIKWTGSETKIIW